MTDNQEKLYNLNDTYIACNRNNSNNIYQLSKFCVNDSNVNGLYECLPNDLENCPYRIALGCWAIIVMIIGVLGNMLTLLALPYAAKRKRYTDHFKKLKFV